MGTHPSKPSTKTLTGEILKEIILSDPEKYLGKSIIAKFGADLPFLFKVLSIEKVLSIQAHPDKALGKILHALDPKNYPDDNHKPEMAIAVTDFEGFCGFKPLEQLASELQTIPELRSVIGDELSDEFCSGIKPEAAVGSKDDELNRLLLQKIFGKLMNTDEATISEKAKSLVERTKTQPELFGESLSELIQRLDKQFPNDIGLFCGCLLLNHCILKPGEAMFLQAKDPHLYINGDIIECMAASDNVVRAGFTPKFKDVKNLVEMLTYSYDDVEKQKMAKLAFERSTGDAKIVLYDPPILEFSVLQTQFIEKPKGSVQVTKGIDGPSILIVTKGEGFLQIKGDELTKIPAKTGFVFFIAPGAEIEMINNDEKEFTSYRAFVEA